MILGDDAVRLRPLGLDDVDEWMAGEDEEQIRGFEFPGPAPRESVVAAIESWMHSWRSRSVRSRWIAVERSLFSGVSWWPTLGEVYALRFTASQMSRYGRPRKA